MITLGPFDLYDLIGRGGMGEVWKATHRASLAPVAIKLLRPMHMRSDRHLAVLRSEIRAMARLDHPGVVWILGAGTVGEAAERQSGGRLVAGTTWLAMELASGGSLTDRVATMDSWAAVRPILTDLLGALAHAHGRGVIHRDLKPGNVILALPSDLRPGWKLTDFGLATALGDYATSTQHGVAGTPQYMAPEQIDRTLHPHGPWTDLYALGCVAWALVTGRSPFGRYRGVEAVMAHLTRPLPEFVPRFAVPPGLTAWLHRLLERDVPRRYRLTADAASALLDLGVDPVDDDEETVPIGSLDRRARGRPGGDVPVAWRERNPGFPRILRGAGLGMVGVRVPRFAGRVAERDALWLLLRAVGWDWRPKLAIVRGAGGIGRSRLAAWVCERAHELGAADYAIVRVIPGESGMRALCAKLLRAPVRAMRQPPWLEPLIEDLEDPELGSALLAMLADPESAPGLATARALLERRTRDRALVVVLDDVGRAPELLDALRELAALPLPVLWVLTTTSDDLVVPGAKEISLGPLDPVARADLLGEFGLAPGLASRLDEEAGGNPGMLVARLAAWSHAGRLVAGPTGIDLQPDGPDDTAPRTRDPDDVLAEAEIRLPAEGWRAYLATLGEAERALERVGTTDPRHAVLAARQASAYLEIGEPAEACVWAGRATAHARRGGAPEIPALAALVLGRASAADFALEEAERHLDGAVELANAADARHVSADALLALSRIAALRGDVGGAIRRVDAAIRAAERSGRAHPADVAAGRAWAAELEDRLVEARERLEDARRLAAGDGVRELAAVEAAADLERRARVPAAAEALYAQALARAEELGSAAAAARAVTALAGCRVAQGRGLAAWEELAVQGARHPPAGALAVALRGGVSVAASAVAGRWDEVDHQVTLALAAAPARTVGLADVVECLALAIAGCRDPALALRLRSLGDDHRSKPLGIL